MYEDLLPVTAAMKAAARYDDAQAACGIASVEQALASCAERVDAALRDTRDEPERRRLRTIYRGLQASCRAAARLREAAPPQP